MKTSLRRAGYILSFFFVVAACERMAEPLVIDRSWMQASSGITTAEHSITARQESLYSCVVEFPEGYDWRRDSLFGYVDCRLNLYRDSVLIESVAGGKHRGISPEADTHFIVGGHLYTFFCSVGKTIVTRDGVRLFDYESEGEVLKGFAPMEDGVYCLSTDGDDLVLRKNGESVLRRSGVKLRGALEESICDPYGALYLDMGRLCFSYSKGEVWYVCRGDELIKTEVPPRMASIRDVRVLEDRVYVAGDEAGSGILRITADGYYLNRGVFRMGLGNSVRLLECRGIPCYSIEGAGFVELWRQDMRLCLRGGWRVHPLSVLAGISFLLISEAGVGLRTVDGTEQVFRDMRLPSVRCCAVLRDGLHLALCGPDRAGIWNDGGWRDAAVNGYVSCLAAGGVYLE